MANQLKMATIDAILGLYQRRWSIRRIAKELGIHRGTVARHIRLIRQGSKPARAPIGSESDRSQDAGGAPGLKTGHSGEGAHEAKIGQALIGSVATEAAAAASFAPAVTEAELKRQPSLCEPWRQVILDKLQVGLTAQRIWQDLVREHGFGGKYHSVRRFVQHLG